MTFFSFGIFSGKYTVEMGFFGSIREEHFNIRVVDGGKYLYNSVIYSVS